MGTPEQLDIVVEGSREPEAGEAMTRYLVKMGVSAQRAAKFVQERHCHSKAALALFLRIHLPPLHMSREDIYLQDMRDLLGVSYRQGRALIQDLAVSEALNTDITAEARSCLSKKGILRHTGAGTELSSLLEGIDTRPIPSQSQACSRELPIGTPGPYHAANVAMRHCVPHYTADVRTVTNYHYFVVFFVTAVTFALYVATRVYYLAWGHSSTASNVSVPYSWVVLTAEVLLGFLAFYGNQTFFQQKTTFTPTDVSWKDGQQVAQRVSQVVRICITTYSEPTETVLECVLRLLIAPEPVYMKKYIYVCDDGYAKSEGPKKKLMVQTLRAMGHDVFYVGDRVKKPHQLNGKSANINHVLMNHIFPGIKSSKEIPGNDILMIMDCDHMVKPEIFMKMGAVMQDKNNAVALVPQYFHNLLRPDCFDAANNDFMFTKMRYYFGAGMCYITGTNFMLRLRVAYEAAELSAENPKHGKFGGEGRLEDGTIQVLSEDQISEDIELGFRIAALGYKTTLIPERLATGEVPEAPRDMWRQRLRWNKGGHLFVTKNSHLILSKQSKSGLGSLPFFIKQLYVLCVPTHFIVMFCEPIIITMPLICLGFDVCPYGMDSWLWLTHVAQLSCFFLCGASAGFGSIGLFFATKTQQRVLFWTQVKAAINCVMVITGYKRPGKFKATAKVGVNPDDHNVTSVSHDITAGTPGAVINRSRGPAGMCGTGFTLQHVHDALSKVTEMRRRWMPLDGTLDAWVLLFFTLWNTAAIAVGFTHLVRNGAFASGFSNEQGVRWIAVVFAFVEAAPGLIFFMYMFVYNKTYAATVMKIWYPAIVCIAAVSVLAIELRVGIAYGLAGDFARWPWQASSVLDS